MVTADLWVDPACPWTWLTARWLLEVEQVRDVRVRLHVMSLALVIGVGPTDTGEVDGAALWGPVRICQAALLSYGDEGLRRVYPALARLIHDESTPAGREMYAQALHRCGLPHSLAYAAPTAWYDAEVETSHRLGMEPMGPDAGCPVLHVPGRDGESVAFFGPVVTPAPRGEAAGRLWDSVALAAGTDGFFELKRHRSRTPDFAA